MKTSESIVKIAPALLAAQKEIGSATKDATNPFFKSKYADLGSVMEACKEALNKNGIVVLQPVSNSFSFNDQAPVPMTFVETILLHESGEFISDIMLASVKQHNDPQAQGSAITYARRYSLQSMMFIPAEDDDAEKATPRPQTTPASAQTVYHTQNSDKCPKCGADMKVSASGGKYCSAICWKNVPKETTEPIKEQAVTAEDEINVDDIPF